MYNRSVRSLIIFFVFSLAVIFIVLSFGELETIVATLRQAHLFYVLLATAIELAWFIVFGRMYWEVYRLLNLRATPLELTRLIAAANFINVVAPSGGLGGVAMIASEAGRRGQPTGRVTAAAALFLLFDQIAFLLILGLGLVVLLRRHNLGAGEIVASLLMLMIAAAYAAVLYLGYRSEKLLGRLLTALVGAVNKLLRPFVHRPYLSDARILDFSRELYEGLACIHERPRSVIRPILWGLLNKSMLMAVLLCAFLSFQVPYSAGTIIAGFSFGYLFAMISPTPAGIGVVEGIMPVMLRSLRVDWSQAVIVTLVYRAITFWLPVGLGALAFRAMHNNHPSSAT